MTRPSRARSRAPPAPVVLLAQSEAGYLNLMKLNSCLYLDKPAATCRRSRWTSLPPMPRA